MNEARRTSGTKQQHLDILLLCRAVLLELRLDGIVPADEVQTQSTPHSRGAV